MSFIPMPTLETEGFTGKIEYRFVDLDGSTDRYFIRLEQGSVVECELGYTKNAEGVERTKYKFFPKTDVLVVVHETDKGDKPMQVRYGKFFFIDEFHPSRKSRHMLDYGKAIANWADQLYIANKNIPINA